MSVAVVARRAGDHADVRLRLRPGIERDRSLSAHVPPRPERHPQGVLDEADGGHVGTALGLLHQHEAVEQLEPLVGAEEAALDELLVLPPTPAPHADRACVHHQAQSRTLPSPASTSTRGYATRNLTAPEGGQADPRWRAIIAGTRWCHEDLFFSSHAL